MRTLCLTVSLAVWVLLAASAVWGQDAPAADKPEASGPPPAAETPTPPPPPPPAPAPEQGDRRPDAGGPPPPPKPEEGCPDSSKLPCPWGPGVFRDATDEEIKDILAFTAENLPLVHEELVQTQTSDPDRFRQMCRRLRFEIHQLKALRASNEEAFHKAIEVRQLEGHIRKLAAALRQSKDSAEREPLKNELREALRKRFEADLFARRARIQYLEAALKRIRQDLASREAQREEILAKQLEEACSDPPSSEPAGPSPDDPPPDGPPPPEKAPR